jgi:hypothetical protein
MTSQPHFHVFRLPYEITELRLPYEITELSLGIDVDLDQFQVSAVAIFASHLADSPSSSRLTINMTLKSSSTVAIVALWMFSARLEFGKRHPSSSRVFAGRRPTTRSTLWGTLIQEELHD